MQTKIIERYFFFGLLSATLLFTLYIFRPFWMILTLAVSFSIVLYPVYLFFTRKSLPDWLASLFTIILFLAVLCIPLLSVGTLVFKQSDNVYHAVVDNNNAVFFNSL